MILFLILNLSLLKVLDITTQSVDQSLGRPLDLTIMSLNPTSMSVSWQPPELIPGARVSVDKYQLFLTEVCMQF